MQQIADEFGVTRPTIYRHLQRPLAEHHSRSMSALLQIAIVAAALWIGSWLIMILLAKRLPPGLLRDVTEFLPPA